MVKHMWLLLLAACTGAAAAPAIRTAAVPADLSAWQWQEVAHGVYAMIAPEGVTPIVSGNAEVIVGDDGVVVVDTTQLPSTARALVAHIKAVTDKPVKFVVTTHWHPDHWTGNGELRAAWPDAVFVATPTTREMARTKALPFMSVDYTTTTSDAVAKALASGKRADGTPLDAFARTYATLAREQLAEYGGELKDAKIVPPEVTFDRELAIHLGAREVDVRFLGRGNTGGDAVVYVPDVKVAITGDLVVAPYPYGIGSYIGEWEAVLRAIEQLDATAIVPGHGPVMHDHVYLDDVIALLHAIREQVAAQKDKPLADVKVDVSALRTKLCGNDPWRQYGFDRVFVAPAKARAYREANEGHLEDED